MYSSPLPIFQWDCWSFLLEYRSPSYIIEVCDFFPQFCLYSKFYFFHMEMFDLYAVKYICVFFLLWLFLFLLCCVVIVAAAAVIVRKVHMRLNYAKTPPFSPWKCVLHSLVPLALIQLELMFVLRCEVGIRVNFPLRLSSSDFSTIFSWRLFSMSY